MRKRITHFQYVKVGRCLISALLVFIFLGSTGEPVLGEDKIFYLRSPESDADRRQDFVHEIIRTVLDRTAEPDASYRIKLIPRLVFARISQSETQDKFPNLIIRLTGDFQTGKHFEVVPIPINRGIVGYRVFLIRKAMQHDFRNISGLSDFSTKGLKAGQGRWTDVEILRENGINVVVGNNYEGLFSMLVNKRFDFFPRGINEAFEEFEARKNIHPEMKVEETLALYYPLPRVLVTNKGNTALAARIERGLRSIFADGTHRKIWRRYNQKWIAESKLENRKVIYLKNPYALPNLPYDQKEYWYQPGETYEP